MPGVGGGSGVGGGAGGGAGSDNHETRLDIGSGADLPGDGFIWIANSGEGTVSKIDTSTMQELGRYRTRPDGGGDPSRTSVSLTGNVVVANRLGGVTKIYSDISDCEDKDGSGKVDTSTGGTDVLPWGDECVAWHTPMTYGSQRAIAWTHGEVDPDADGAINEKVWVSGDAMGAEGVDIMLLNGDTGEIENQTTIKLMNNGPKGFPYRAYGGAVDREGDFWFTTLGGPSVVVRVRLDDMSADQWPKQQWSYGLTVDRKGRVFTCEVEVGRFDPETQTWTHKSAWEVGSEAGWDQVMQGEFEIDMGGCMVDGEDRLWVPVRNQPRTWHGVAALDAETLKGLKFIELPQHPHGISIDFEGFVWGVTGTAEGTSLGNEAYKIDPETGTYEIFDKLNGAYTYSDMTGFALQATTEPVE